MERTTTITLGGTIFSLTESAFATLSHYLERLKTHFASESGADEIMRDIESRIAEKLFHKKDGLVVEDDIRAVIAEIGEATEFDDEEETSAAKPASKKLYRDTVNGLIGGVCSGLGNYFDIDPLWIRLVFLASIFFGGTGILLYLVLWVLIPEAKNASQRLEMHGKPVDLEGIARMVKERVEDIETSGSVQRLFRSIGRVIHSIFRILGKIVGTLLALGAFAAAIGLISGAGIVLANWNAPYNDFPLRNIISDALLVSGFLAGFITILIPLIGIFTLGIRLIKRKIAIPNAIGFALVTIWVVAFCATGTIAATVAGQYYEYVKTAPEYQMETRELNVTAFNRVSVHDAHIVLKKGSEQSVVLSGRAIDMDNATATVADGTLTVSSKGDHSMCIFCVRSTPEITITTPDLDALWIEDGFASLDTYSDDALEIEILSALLRGTMTIPSLSLKTENGSISASITSDTLTIDADDSHLDLRGSANTATINLENSSFQAESFTIKDATLTTDSSYGRMHVSGKLTQNNDSSSRIINHGVRE